MEGNNLGPKPNMLEGDKYFNMRIAAEVGEVQNNAILTSFVAKGLIRFNMLDIKNEPGENLLSKGKQYLDRKTPIVFDK